MSDLNQMSTAGSRKGRADTPAGKPWQLGPMSIEAAATQPAKTMCEVAAVLAGPVWTTSSCCAAVEQIQCPLICFQPHLSESKPCILKNWLCDTEAVVVHAFFFRMGSGELVFASGSPTGNCWQHLPL